ncbi:MAG: peptidylprolyl isomerase [Betaproteobacteria bacterium]|jgi:peptidyl-prolyl cis-trans isomerase SurA|nr:peptidylprolyl isomerase [Betaproteobacteria bacterium]
MATGRTAALRAAVAALACAALPSLAQIQLPKPAPGAPAAAPRPAPAAPSRPAAPAAAAGREVLLDRVVAVVNDEALTQYELDAQRRAILAQMREAKMTPPATDVLERQVLERMITERALLQFARETGIRVDDTGVERTIARIAQDNKLTPDQFRAALQREGIPYAKYREDVRREMTVQRLREREAESRANVSDAEVDQFLQLTASRGAGDAEYQLAHILVGVPEQSSPDQLGERRRRAEDALAQIKGGADFAQVAAALSDAPDALQGGNLGWRAAARLPTVFVEVIRGMKPGDVSEVLRSPAGYHIVKLVDLRDRNAPVVVEQARVRHVLVRVSETVSEADAKARIDRVKDRLDTGAKFEDMARINSEDPSSARGGELGWVSPGDTVPEFEQAFRALALGEVSQPVRTPFGWHLIRVDERRTQDVTQERQREQARMALRQRRSDELFADFVRQTRDRAYVEYKADER